LATILHGKYQISISIAKEAIPMFVKSFKRFNLVIFIAIFLATTSWAAPTINSVKGSMSESQTITINGSNFSSKPVAAPISFLKDNIEKGISGSVFNDSGWNNPGAGKRAIYTDGSAYSGKKSILFDFQGDWQDRSFFIEKDLNNQKEVYVTAWIKLVKSGPCTKFQWKNWRVKQNAGYNIANDSNGTGVIGDLWYPWGSTARSVQVFIDGKSSNQGWMLDSSAFAFDKWQRIEAYYKHSDPNRANGQISWERIGYGDSLAGGAPTNRSAVITRSSSADYYRYLILGHYFGNFSGCDDNSARLQVFYDDIYVDNTPARVEIGNSNKWSNCTVRDIQAPSQWSNSSVSVTVSTPSFASNQKAYIYIVDINGNVNSEGYPITIGNSSTVPPSYDQLKPPSGLFVTEK